MLQIVKIKDIIRPADRKKFNDVYIVYELMDTDLHQIICSRQALTDDHCQVKSPLSLLLINSILTLIFTLKDVLCAFFEKTTVLHKGCQFHMTFSSHYAVVIRYRHIL